MGLPERIVLRQQPQDRRLLELTGKPDRWVATPGGLGPQGQSCAHLAGTLATEVCPAVEHTATGVVAVVVVASPTMVLHAIGTGQ